MSDEPKEPTLEELVERMTTLSRDLLADLPGLWQSWRATDDGRTSGQIFRALSARVVALVQIGEEIAPRLATKGMREEAAIAVLDQLLPDFPLDRVIYSALVHAATAYYRRVRD